MDIYDILAKKYDMNKLIIKEICHHPFKFAKNAIQSSDDTKTLMFTYLGKIKIKPYYAEDKGREPKRKKPKE